MSLTVIRPLTMRELLTDATYRPYLLRAPRLPPGCRTGSPWQVWGLRDDDRWAGKTFAEYREAFELVKKMIRGPYQDVAIICRPTEFGPPDGFQIPPLMDWCGRCRRPTVFRRSRKHHAAKNWPAYDSDVLRCYYCAARQPTHRWYR